MGKLLVFVIAFVMLISDACNQEVQKDKPEKRIITLENSPSKRPYSPAVEAGNTLYVSGQVATDQATGKLIESGIEGQTKQVLINLSNIIEKAGYSMEDVVKCTVLLQDISFYSAVNQIYMEFFPKNPPARMAFAVKDLPLGALIEIDAIAVK